MMNEELIQIIANYGVPTFLTLYVVWWFLNKGVPMINHWVVSWIAATAQQYTALSERDTTLNGEIQSIAKDVAVIQQQLNSFGISLTNIEKKQGWEERKIIEILNGLGYNKKWDDPQNLDKKD